MECLADAESWIRALEPVTRVYALRFGESDGAVHFHVVPRTQRILDAFLVQRPGEPPHSGARIVDWLWFHQDELGYSDRDIEAWVERARAHIGPGDDTPRSWSEMAVAARQYCEWIETLETAASTADHPEVEHQRCLEARGRILAVLQAGAALGIIDDCGLDEDDDPLLSPDWDEVYRRAGAVPVGYYYCDALDKNRNALTGHDGALGDASDDLADIWRDLKRGLDRWDRGAHRSAAWQWSFSFPHHWGTHAVGVLRELQIKLSLGA